MGGPARYAGGPVVILWRAAPAEGAWFGRCSYWTHDQDFARRFRALLAARVGGEFVIYRADLELTAVLDIPFGTFLDSARVNAGVRLGWFAEDGYRWLAFYEEPWYGVWTKQYVYLGTEPVEAARHGAG